MRLSTEVDELQQLAVDALKLCRSNSFHIQEYRGCVDDLTKLAVSLSDARQCAQDDVVLFRYIEWETPARITSAISRFF